MILFGEILNNLNKIIEELVLEESSIIKRKPKKRNFLDHLVPQALQMLY
jgi:hypothetical protein